MKFSYNLVKQFLSKQPPEAHKLAGLLTMHSFEIEDVEKKENDYILDADILPNRAHDAASHIGFAREVAALTGGKLKDIKKSEDYKKKTNETKSIKIEVKNKDLCERYTAGVVEGVDVKDSPAWLRNLLNNTGLNSINNVVDVVNYAMLVTGQPMHAFDLDKIEGGKIIVRNAKQGESITTLDGEAFILNSSDLVIADAQSPLAIAGVKGGVKAEVTKETKNVVLEAAYFNPVNVRHTTRHLGVHTDSSWRFEHSISKAQVDQSLYSGMEFLKRYAGGKPLKEVIDIMEKSPAQVVISLRPEYVHELLGVRITSQKISSILKSLGFEVIPQKNRIKVKVPSWRLDIEREEDLIEEVGRIFGYENISPEMPHGSLYPPERDVKNYWKRQVQRNFADRGLNEVYNYSFISESDASLWQYNTKDLWEVENPVSNEFKHLRPSLLPGILKNAKHNLKFKDHIEYFEIGEIFSKSTKEREKTNLALAVASKRKNSEDFYELKAYVVDLFNRLGISDVWFDDALKKKEEKEISFMHHTRVAQIKTGSTFMGYIGQVHPRIAAAYSLKGSVSFAELDFDMLAEEAEKEEIYTPVSDYPKIVRDISVLVSKFTKTDEVIRAINDGGGKLLRDVDMFDYYEEAKNTESKSMAFHLIFQAEDRTLNSSEVDNLVAKIEREIKKKGWQVK